MGKIYVGQIGVQIELETGDDLTGATKTEIRYRKPDKTTGIWTGTVDGGKICYLITDPSILVAGIWKVQAYAEGSGWALPGETAEFTVYNLWK